MSVFSECLNYHIARTKIKISSLSKITAINRTLLQKMLTGDRIPANQTSILTIAHALCLTAQETETFLESYHITRMGKAAWNRLVSAKNFVEGFRLVPENQISIVSQVFHRVDLPKQDNNIIRGEREINRFVKIILEIESIREQGHIRLALQPGYHFAVECLASLSFQGTSIDHLLGLQGTSDEESSSVNLACLSGVTPLLLTHHQYNLYGYFDHISSLFNSLSGFPYLILTSEYCVQVSYDLDAALVSSSPEFLNLWIEKFEKRKEHAFLLCSNINSFAKYLMQMQVVDEDITDVYTLLSQPCTGLLLPAELIARHIDIEHCDKEVIEYAQEQFRRPQRVPFTINSYFSEEGLVEFMETGRFTEVPAEFYSPMTMAERICILENMKQFILDGVYVPHMIRPSKFVIPKLLAVDAISPKRVIILVNRPQKGFSAFTINEPSLSKTLYDFLVYLQSSPYIDSFEESVQTIDMILARYRGSLTDLSVIK